MNPKRIPLQKFTPLQATQNLEHYTREGHDPPLSVLLSMPVHTGGSNVDTEGKPRLGQDANMRKWHEFLSFARVYRILQAVKADEVDERVRERLQTDLSKEAQT